MRNDLVRVVLIGLLPAALMAAVPSAAHDEPAGADPVRSLRALKLQTLVNHAVQQACVKFGERKLTADQIAVTLVDLTDTRNPVRASHRGAIRIYPASVVKLFYLAAAEQWMEDWKIRESDEVRRAMRDMIVESYNEATHYLVDLLTGTTSGPELEPGELERWYEKRNAVNRHFSSLGYTNINVNRKPWCEGPYGREIQSVRAHQPNHRNWLTTDATARLLTEIVTGKAVSPARSAAMLKLLERDPFSKSSDPDDQAHGFTGPAIPAGAKLWSKAGWTSETRHDAACIELADGTRLVLVIFTTDHASERGIIPTIARMIIEGMK